MTGPVELTEKQRMLHDEIVQGLTRWVVAQMAKTPDQQLADYVAWQQRTVETLNEAPVEERLAFLAAITGSGLDEVEASVSGVTFRVDDEGGLIADVLLIRPVEQVYMTVTLSPADEP